MDTKLLRWVIPFRCPMELMMAFRQEILKLAEFGMDTDQRKYFMYQKNSMISRAGNSHRLLLAVILLISSKNLWLQKNRMPLLKVWILESSRMFSLLQVSAIRFPCLQGWLDLLLLLVCVPICSFIIFYIFQFLEKYAITVCFRQSEQHRNR